MQTAMFTPPKFRPKEKKFLNAEAKIYQVQVTPDTTQGRTLNTT
jgi:hypothetical protein